jgi:hypothetical protein
MKCYWHEEEWLRRTSFGTRRRDKRGRRRNNVAISLCIMHWRRVIGNVWKGSLTAAVLRPQIKLLKLYKVCDLRDAPGHSAFHNITLPHGNDVRGEVWDGCYLRRRSRNAGGWMLIWLNRWRTEQRLLRNGGICGN